MLLPVLLLAAALLALPAAAHAAPGKGPDLTITQAKLQGGVLDLTVRNAGRKGARPSVARIFAVAGGERVRLADVKVKKLAAGRKAAVRTTIVAPSAPGTYELLVCADARAVLKEAKETNNCRTAGRLTIAGPPVPTPPTPSSGGVPPAPPAPTPGPQPANPTPAPSPQPTPAPPADAPDLAATDVSDPPGEVVEGGSFPLDDTVANEKHAAAASTTRFYLSPDAEVSLHEREAAGHALADIVMGGHRDVPALAAGATSSNNTPTLVRVPPGTRPGVYNVLACADDREDIAEAEEGDNCVAATHPENGEEKLSVVKVVAETQEYRIDALSDVFDPEEVELDPSACADVTTGSVPSIGAALSSANSFLESKAPAAMDAFKASAEYGNPLALQEAAGAAVVQGAPAAALASLLRAHELEPAEASHLVNAAPIASGLGMPAEALAFLDKARRLDDSDLPAMGISRHAVALTNRGHALALLGRWDEAERALEAALAAEPLLTEAQATLGTVELCGRNDADAASERAKSARTRRGPQPLDWSRGVASALRNIEFPGFPKQAVSMSGYFDAFSQKLAGESVATSQQVNGLIDTVNAKVPQWTRAQLDRYRAVKQRYAGAQAEDDLKAERNAFWAKLDEASDTGANFWIIRYVELLHEAGDACEGSQDSECFDVELSARCRPALNSAHQEWVDHMDESYALAKTYFGRLSKRMDGYGAHISDPDGHALALAQIRQHEINVASLIVQEAGFWSLQVKLHQQHCVETVEPSPAVPADAAAVGSEGGCPPLLQSISGVLDFGSAKIKASCESVKLELSSVSPIPWIKGFAEVEYKFKTQQVTVVSGVKAEIPAGVAKGSFKSGFYTVIDAKGFQDVGWRVGPSFSVGAGPVEFKIKDEISMSMLGSQQPAD